jgi:hypothetical protein
LIFAPLWLVIPGKPESILIFALCSSSLLEVQSFRCRCAPAGNFLDSGHPALRPSGPAPLFAPLLRRSAGAKKVTKETP